jgi:hypothetical protein
VGHQGIKKLRISRERVGDAFKLSRRVAHRGQKYSCRLFYSPLVRSVEICSDSSPLDHQNVGQFRPEPLNRGTLCRGNLAGNGKRTLLQRFFLRPSTPRRAPSPPSHELRLPLKSPEKPNRLGASGSDADHLEARTKHLEESTGLASPSSGLARSANTGRHPGTNFKIIHSTEVSAEVSNEA